jgi:hypothetical protein
VRLEFLAHARMREDVATGDPDLDRIVMLKASLD